MGEWVSQMVRVLTEAPRSLGSEEVASRGTLLTEVALHPGTLVLLKLGHGVAEERNDQLLQGKRRSVRDRRTDTQPDMLTDKHRESRVCIRVRLKGYRSLYDPRG